MATTTSMDYTRVTVLAPSLTVDLALPAQVAIASLLPELLLLTRVPATPSSSWCMSRIGGPGLDPDSTLAESQIADGELLCLRAREQPGFAPVYEDLPDAVSAEVGQARQWTAALSRLCGHVVVAGCLLVLAVTIWFEPDHTVAGRVGIGAAVTLLAAGALVRRSAGHRGSRAVWAAGVLPMAVIGAVRSTPHGSPLLVGAATLLIASVSTGLLIPETRRVAAAGAVVGTLTALAVTVASIVPTAGQGAARQPVAAAVAVAVLLGCLLLPLAARVAARSVRTSGHPYTPGSDGPARLAARAREALDILTGITLGIGVVVGTAAVVLALSGNRVQMVLAATGLAVILLHTRTLRVAAPMLTLLAPGLIAAVVVAVATAATAGGWRWTTLALALAAAAAVTVPGRSFSPAVRRLVDVAHAVLLLALVPLAVAVLDLYRLFRQL